MQWKGNQGAQKRDHGTIHLTPNLACLWGATTCEQQVGPSPWSASLQKAAAWDLQHTDPTVPTFTLSGKSHFPLSMPLYPGADAHTLLAAWRCGRVWTLIPLFTPLSVLKATEYKLHHTDLPITSALTWSDHVFWHGLRVSFNLEP